MPKFTVLIPTHDHADLLFWSVASVQAQTRQDFELFIVGDGVPDRTREMAAALRRQDGRIRFFNNPKGPRNGEMHRHQALQQATGELICYQCDDDLWLPDHLETLEGLLAEHDLAHTMQIEIAPDGGPPTTWFFNAQLPAQVEALQRNETGFGTATAGHTAAAYRALPFGWRTTPPEHNVDLYMWLQFLEQPGCRVFSLPWPTVVRFPAPLHRGWTLPERLAEHARWFPRLMSPTERLALIREAMVSLCAQTHAGHLDAIERTAQLADILTALQTKAPARPAVTGIPRKRLPPYQPGAPLDLRKGGGGLKYLGHGFSWPESWGVWTEGASATIVLPLEQPLTGNAELALEYAALSVPQPHAPMRVLLWVNDRLVDDWDVVLTGQIDHHVIPLPADLLRETPQVTLRLHMEHPLRPADFASSTDSRWLGLGLIRLNVQRVA